MILLGCSFLGLPWLLACLYRTGVPHFLPLTPRPGDPVNCEARVSSWPLVWRIRFWVNGFLAYSTLALDHPVRKIILYTML
jgi:hypothetical protein